MEPLLLDPALAETRVAFGMAEAEVAQRMQWRASAGVFRAIDATLSEAQAHPEVFVDREMLRGDATELALRAAIADLAVRLNLAESTVRTHGMTAAVLRSRLPELWAWFAEGEVPTQNAREAATLVIQLRDDLSPVFEEQILTPARTLAPARFRARAKAIRDRLQADTLTERHLLAKERRGLWSEQDQDGMSWMHVLLPSDDLAKVTAHVDGIAFGYYSDPEESRSMAQLRVDTMVDLLTGDPDASGKGKVGVTVALTVPVLSLLGQSTEPAELEGVGPIDLDTARRLAAEAPSITRLLTDPISGVVLTMDAEQYRPSKALKRWLALKQVICDFPGCGRRAVHCDLDHTVAWAAGGATSAVNLVHRCRKHHRMKHESRWKVETPPGSERSVWTSPTGYTREADPPPF